MLSRTPSASGVVVAARRSSASLTVAQQPDVRMVAVEGEGAKYWPVWRGPSGQGLVIGTLSRTRWSATENVAWKKPVPGRGNSSPIVWGDRIFLTTAHDGGRRVSLHRVPPIRRHAAVGDVRARRPDRPRALQERPRVGDAGDRRHARLRVFRQPRAGGVRFRRQARVAQDLGDVDNYHGAAGSPLLYKNRVILYQDFDGGSFVAAFDSRTGKAAVADAAAGIGRMGHAGGGARRHARRDHRQQPVLRDGLRSRHRPRAVGLRRQLVRSDPDAGRRSRPRVCVVGTRRADAGDPAGRPRATSRARISRGRARKARRSCPSPILYGDQLYIVNDMASIVTSFEAATGKVLWQGRLGVAQREGFSASPVAVDGKVFFTNDQGETFVLRAGPTFELLRTNRIGETTLASPALVDGRWYIRTDRSLFAIGR